MTHASTNLRTSFPRCGLFPLHFVLAFGLGASILGFPYDSDSSAADPSATATTNSTVAIGFEDCRPGPFQQLKTAAGQWTAEEGHAEIDNQHAKSGKNSLHVFGGQDRAVEFQLDSSAKAGGLLTFWAERWTSRRPFSFRVDKFSQGRWEEIYNGDQDVKVGGFLTNVKIDVGDSHVPRFRWRVTSPEKSGLLIDDITFAEPAPMAIATVTTEQPTYPVLIGSPTTPVARVRIDVAGNIGPAPIVRSLTVDTQGTTDLSDLVKVEVYYSGGNDVVRAWGNTDIFAGATALGRSQPPRESIEFKGRQLLQPGANYFWISYTLKATANVDHRVDAGCSLVCLEGGQSIKPEVTDPTGTQRLGVAVRRRGDDGVHTYRIPGLATTNQGTLIGVYDCRHRGSGDLPGDINIGMSRSTDGGQTWEPMQVIMDMGDDPQWRYDGIGDPAVLVDRKTGTIWVTATWSHGNRSWVGSGPGLKPEETGQFMLVKSDDDGRTWSKPINVTNQIKRPEWCFLLQGPGKGITMQDGTIVFAAQFQDTPEDKRLPRSTIVYSRDQGVTWHVGTGAFDDTTEAQVVELEPGVLMLNCRYNRESTRVIMTTRDMGKSWQVHSTSRKALVEPGACMASLINVDRERGNKVGRRLLFSNPNSLQGRQQMTLKASGNQGATWPETTQLLLDTGTCAGYSCMSMIDDQTVGILYEGSQAHMTFQRVPLREIVSSEKHPGQPIRVACVGDSITSPDRPNVLLIVSEDNGPELGCYGDPYARTPHLDNLAREGVRFENAFVTYSVCSPSRGSIFTGLYPHQNGQIGLATHKFAMYREWPNLVNILKQDGYRTGIIGKIHVNPESAFPCDFRAFPGSNFNNRPVRKFADAAAEFINAADEPFFLMVNFPDAHFPLLRQQYGLPEHPQNANDVRPLPWVGADSPRLREFTANYYNCMARLDTGVGMLLEELESSGEAQDTLVIYLGDHGAQFSRGKTSVYEAGLRIPWIVRFPGVSQAGLVRRELVSIVDLLPTVLDAAGLEAPDNLPGRSLKPLVEGDQVTWRKHIFGVASGGAPSIYFPQSSVRDERYKLIVSHTSGRENASARAYLQQMNVHFAAGTNKEEISQSPDHVREAYARYLNPPRVELYDLQNDPHEWHDLSGAPNMDHVKQRLLATLHDWQDQTHDPLAKAELLRQFTQEHDDALNTNYRQDKTFRWKYLDSFDRHVWPTQ